MISLHTSNYHHHTPRSTECVIVSIVDLIPKWDAVPSNPLFVFLMNHLHSPYMNIFYRIRTLNGESIVVLTVHLMARERSHTRWMCWERGEKGQSHRQSETSQSWCLGRVAGRRRKSELISTCFININHWTERFYGYFSFLPLLFPGPVARQLMIIQTHNIPKKPTDINPSVAHHTTADSSSALLLVSYICQ